MAEDLKSKNILIIVESPTKRDHIQEYLRKAGYKVRVMASKGHIMELANDRNSYYNTGIYIDKAFDMNLQISEDHKKLVMELKNAASTADMVFVMSDPDREGEAIAWSLVKFLKLPKNKTKRAVTHEISPEAVVNAIENAIPFNDNLAQAALTRMSLDKMVGFRLSPIANTYIGAKSIGRCQSAGLKLVVDREREIQSFVPESYYDLYLNFQKNKTKFKAKYIGTAKTPIEHLKDKTEAMAVKRACDQDFTVLEINKREKQESPKPPFCTATFQQEANSKLGLKTKDVMDCAQKLFEAGFITYHRTDDTTIGPEFVPALKKFIESTYGKKSFVTPRKGKKQDNAQEGHECLRVTKPELTPEKAETEIKNSLLAKVYKIIWQRTIAAAMPNAIISETSYIIVNHGQRFLLVSNELLSEGYKAVYSYKDDDEEEMSAVKETFTQGEKLQNTALEEVAKATKPKPRFKESTLNAELQKRGIGRPSTYATIIENILSDSRGYCTVDDKKCIVPTERGMSLISFTDRAFPDIISINYTKDMEAELDNIAEGKNTREKFLTAFHEHMENSIKNNKEINPAGAAEAPKCPKCGAPMVIRRSKYGKLFYGCSKYPSCTGIVSVK